MEDLLSLHRKQLRDLQSVITQKKKSATKKTRRGVNDECDRLERELKDKQAEEIAALEGTGIGGEETPSVAQDVDEVAEKLEGAQIDESSTDTPPTNHERLPSTPSSASAQGKKPNRQKARLARRAAQIEEISAEAAAEAASQPDARAIEAARMKKLFEENSLDEIQIAPDGHCLYSAFAVGLEGAGIQLSESSSGGRPYTHTRAAAGRYITKHPDDFAPFLEEGITLEDHVNKVTSTAEWGGEMEVLALAMEYGVTVKVVQAQGQGITSMNDGQKADIWLAYHRRGYGLGEHYNALKKKA